MDSDHVFVQLLTSGSDLLKHLPSPISLNLQTASPGLSQELWHNLTGWYIATVSGAGRTAVLQEPDSFKVPSYSPLSSLL